MPERTIRFFEAIREATQMSMARDKSVYVMGLGVPDPKGIFGTTVGLQKRFGKDRVMDIPCSENAMTGIALGSAISGMRPILTHQRLDFALLSIEQLVNQAAKWRYMFGGKVKAPLVIRLLIGRGWGQGPQHSQSLFSWFAHIPGLKVVAPATPYDAKGLFISSVEDNNPVIFFEHRWLHPIEGSVPKGLYRVPIGKSSNILSGNDLTIVSFSHMTLTALESAELLKREGITADVIDLRSLRPLDMEPVLNSVKKTGRLLVAEPDWMVCGVGSEVVAQAAEKLAGVMRSAPVRLGYPDCPAPTTPALAKDFYPRAYHLFSAGLKMVKNEALNGKIKEVFLGPLDVPHLQCTAPF